MLGQSRARSVLFLQTAVFALKKSHMLLDRSLAIAKRIDQQFTGALVDFIGEELRWRRRLFEWIEFRERIQNAFDQFAKSALKLYTEVVQVDGIVEKIEAQGKIEAMRGLNEKVTRLSR